MRATEFIVENADSTAVTALQKKHGWSTGTTGYGDLYFTWQGNTYVFYGERMRINWPNDESVSVVWGKKPDWQGRGNDEVSFAQAVQRKLLKIDLSIWQQLDRRQINDNQAIQKFKAENERQAREAIAQGVTEDREKFNTDLMKPGFRWSQEINGITYLVRTQWDNMPEVVAKVNNREVGRATFIDHHTRSGLESVSTYVSPKWQGHGIAKNMYAVVRMLGANIQPSATQTAMGKDMWAKWEKQGDAGHVKNLNPRIKEQTVTEGKLSVDVPNEEWLQDKIEYAKSKGRNSFGVPYMGSTTAGVVGTPPRVRVMRLASLPGMRNEQMNVRKNDLKWLMDYMEKTGKLPPMGSNPNEEYLPYIMVAYNGEAWVNEGNHRIMAAYRLNWQDMPIEIRYFDGGERIATGPMAPGKIGLA